jgi:hypothetical protein
MILNNNCPFDVWVRQGVAKEPGSRRGRGENYGEWSGRETLEVKVGSGEKYITPVPVVEDSCGHAGKR